MGSNNREVPKSITFKGAPSREVSNKRFSGFKSLINNSKITIIYNTDGQSYSNGNKI